MTSRPRVVGFAGGSGSGKSTLAAAVRAALGEDACVMVSCDDVYKTLPEAFRADPEAFNFDEPASLDIPLLQQALDDLLAGRDTHVPVYDFATHTRVGERAVPARPWVLVDGILLLALPGIPARLDLSVFVDTPEPVRLYRRIVRDQRDRGRALPDILQQYFRTVRPMHEAHVAPSVQHADLVVDGTAPLDALVAQVMDALALPPSTTERAAQHDTP